jgi:hypothetical protein
MTPQEQETPDLQTQLNRAARFSQHMSRVKVYGNRPVIQPKIAVGAPGDKYEVEADQMADRVMSMAAPGKNQSIQREALPEEDEKDPLQAKALAASITPVVQRESLPAPEEEDTEQLAQTKPLGSSSSYLQRESLPAPEEEEDPTLAQTKPLGSSSSYLQRETLEAPEEEEDPQLAQTKPLGSSSSYLQRESLPAPEEEEDPQLAQTKPLGSSSSYLQRETLPAPEEEEDPQLAQTKPLGSSSSYLQRETLPAPEEEEDPQLAQTKPLGSTSSYLQRETLPAPEEEEDPQLAQTKSLGSSSSYLQRETLEAPEEEEDPQLAQTKPSRHKAVKDQSFDAGSNVESQLNNSKGGGSPLPDEVRSFMEARFGADLSQVRVHTGSEAVEMNKELNAQAFTHGKDIYFGSGRYNPGSSEGKHLLAHELTHVLQQTGAVQPKLEMGHVATEYKQDANQARNGNASESLGSSQKVVQQKCAACQEEDKKLMRQENPTADKKKQDIDITVPTDTSTQLLAGVIFAEASPIKETRESDQERKAIGSVFLNAVKHTQDLCGGVIGKDLKKHQRDFICNIDRRELGDNLVDAVKIGSVAYGQERWKRVMNGSQMLPANKLGDLNKFEKIFLVRAIKAAQAVIGGQEREYDLVRLSKYSSPPNKRMESVETLGQHTFFKFKKDLECGEWKENK